MLVGMFEDKITFNLSVIMTYETYAYKLKACISINRHTFPNGITGAVIITVVVGFLREEREYLYIFSLCPWARLMHR